MKKRQMYILFALMVLQTLIACKNFNKESPTHETIDLIGNRLKLPKDLPFILLDGDTLENLPQTDFTIINYVDSLGCVPCNLQTLEWKFFMEEINSFLKNQVTLVVYVTPKEGDCISDLMWILKGDNFNYPVCFDKEGQFLKANKLSGGNSCHTFLLDANYKILSAGNPIVNPSAKEAYLSILQREK